MEWYKIIVVSLFFVVLSLPAQIDLRIHQPPPNQLKIEDLWGVEIINKTGKSHTVYLHAEITESKKGLLFRANSNTFGLPEGRKRIRPKDIKEVKDEWYRPQDKRFVLRTGSVPPGNYKVCLYLREARARRELARQCISVMIRPASPPRLISPKAGRKIKIRRPTFTWTRPAPLPSGEKVFYKFKIVEVYKGQTKEEAIRENPAWYEEDRISSEAFQYPLKVRELDPDKQYAWQVQAFYEEGVPLEKNRGLSEIWKFNPGDLVKLFPSLPTCLKMGEFTIKDITYDDGSSIDSLSGSGKSFFLQRALPGHLGGPIFVYQEIEFDVDFEGLEGNWTRGEDTAIVLSGEIEESFTSPLEVEIRGYCVSVHDIHMWPDSARAGLGVTAACLYDTADLKPVRFGPFEKQVAPEIDFYEQLHIKNRGPFRLGKTGILLVLKKEVEIDLSTVVTPYRMGVKLIEGETIEQPGMDTSNTGFLYGKYEFQDGLLTPSGFKGTLELVSPIKFTSLVPMGFRILLNDGLLLIEDCKVKRGNFTSGGITLPAGKNGVLDSSGDTVELSFDSLFVDSLLNLSGDVTIDDDEIRWGGFGLVCRINDVSISANFLLPGSPYSYHSVIDGDTLLYPDTDTLVGLSLPILQHGILKVYSGDSRNVLRFVDMGGWFNLEMQGMRGNLSSWQRTPKYRIYLGVPDSSYYLADEQFATVLSHEIKDTTFMKFWFVGNSAFESDLRGSFDIPYPCNIKAPFRDLEVTSTASFSGGNAVFKNSMLTLDYWGVGFTSNRGVVSVRTGEIVYTDAYVYDTLHFSKGFNIIWGEMLADGDLGQFSFNHNTANQKFDGFPLTLDSAALSEYDKNAPGELVVRADLHFDFFGEPDKLITIHDAVSQNLNPPYYGRYVTIEPEEFSLFRRWGSGTSVFDFPEMDYDEGNQYGFKGKGHVKLEEILPTMESGLSATIIIDSTAAAVCMKDESAKKLEFSPFVAFIEETWGCAYIEGDELHRIVMGSNLHYSTGFFIFAEADENVEVKTVITPTISRFTARGLIYFSALGSNAELDGMISLSYDRSIKSVEGEIDGVFDFGNIGVDVEADGQANWHFGTDADYIQGKVGLKICELGFGAGFSAGLFLGYNAPKANLWVLREGSSESRKFGINMNDLPDNITGVYVFGDVERSVSVSGLIQGGIEIYAGVGALGDYSTNSDYFIDGKGVELCVIGIMGAYIYGEILAGVVSASAWGKLILQIGTPSYFEGEFGLRGCVIRVLCASVDITAGVSSNKGLYIRR
jgi:hypothetical protein